MWVEGVSGVAEEGQQGASVVPVAVLQPGDGSFLLHDYALFAMNKRASYKCHKNVFFQSVWEKKRFRKLTKWN